MEILIIISMTYEFLWGFGVAVSRLVLGGWLWSTGAGSVYDLRLCNFVIKVPSV
jgi:hypothetical protein